jgi:VWFA-related protein
MSSHFGPIRKLPALALALFSLIPFANVLAQDAPQGPAATQPEASQEPIETLKFNVNVVNLFFNVKDKHGALLSGLTRDDFQVFEDGKPQTIKYFSAETNLPLTLGMMIDTSGSQQRVLYMEQEVGSDFLRQIIRPKDLAYVISFDVNVDLQQDLTASVRDLSDSLHKTRINTGGAGGIPGLGGGPVPNSNPRGTLLYDAIYLSANEKLAHEVGRKAMIILTDGVDQGSRMSLPEAIEAAQRADAMCYVLLVADRGFYGSGYVGDREMKKLAEETGGRMIEVGPDEQKLNKAFQQIADELRSQYSLGYTPTNRALDGSYRKVEIKSKKGKVQARQGYYAPKS